jgi:hypothetical protein
MPDYIDGAYYWIRTRGAWWVARCRWYDSEPRGFCWHFTDTFEDAIEDCCVDEVGPLIGRAPHVVLRPNPVREFAAFMETRGFPVDQDMIEAWAAYCEEPITPHGADPEANEHA